MAHKTVRWGLVGIGDIANKRVAAAIQDDPNSELVAVCRRSVTELSQFADLRNVPCRFTDAGQLIASPEVDAVYIATPVDCHCPQTIAAAKAGKHVLVEKPMALNANECDEMIAACDRAGVQLGVAYYRRFYPVVLRVQEIIRAGALGRVLSVACVTGNPNRFPPDNWRVIRSRGGGGPLMDIGSHRLDVFVQLLGDASSVKASVVESGNFEAEQATTVLLQFGTGPHAGSHGILQCYFGTIDTPDRLEVIGTEGRITIEDLNQGDLAWYDRKQMVRESHPPASNLHAPLIEDFASALRENRLPAISGQVGKVTSDLIDRAYASAGRK